MALVKLSTSRLGSIPTWLSKSTHKFNLHKVAVVCPIQVAHLLITHGEMYPGRKPPFPYWKKNFTLLNHFIDRTDDRMTENTKVITIDGPNAIGKTEFAERLAKEFDMKVFTQTEEDRLFLNNETGLDLRRFNCMLPDRFHYDKESLFTDKQANVGTSARLQLGLYRCRFLDYANALCHLFNSGQGIVLVRSPYSDPVFADTLHQMNFMSTAAHRHYHYVFDHTICELLTPHISIYLDSPVDMVKRKIKERGTPYEQNSPVITDRFLQLMEKNYKEKYLPKMKKTGEVYEVPWDEDFTDVDWDFMIEDLSKLQLEATELEQKKFEKWFSLSNEELTGHRMTFADRVHIHNMFDFPIPVDCGDDYLYDTEGLEQMEFLFKNHAFLKYSEGYVPEAEGSLKLLFKR